MSDHLTALYLTNPELATALRRQQMGAQLLQQGGDTSPILSPWQGAARLAQALVGGYELRKGDEAIEGSAQANKQALADALSRDSVLQGQGAKPAAALPQAPQDMPQATSQAVMPKYGSPELTGIVAPLAQKYGVPLDMALGLFRQESSGNPNAVGDGGKSVGLGQIQAATAANPGYGVAPLDPALRTDPTANADFALRYLAAKGRAAGATDLTNPEHQAIALRAYNGGGDPNYVENVRAQMPGQSAQPQGNVPTGVNAPMVQQGLALMNEAQRNMMSFDPRLKALGTAQMERAKTLMQLDTFADLPGGGQRNARTGQLSYPPAQRFATDAQGNLLTQDAFGNVRQVAPGGANPGVSPEANAMRTLQTYPPDSPEYRDAYAHLYGERTEMTPNGPVTYRPRTPPAGLVPPGGMGVGAPSGAATGGAPGAGVTYNAPVQPNAALARRINVPLADSNPYEGMTSEAQQKAKTEAINAVRDRYAKRDETDDKTDEMVTQLQRFKELNKNFTTGPLWGTAATRMVGNFNPTFQEMQAITANVAPNMRVIGSGASSDADVTLFKTATVGVDKDPKVNRNIADAAILAAQNKRDKQAFVQAYVEANGHEQGADRMWDAYTKANPIFDPDKKETYGLNTKRVDWQTWFNSAIDPQTGRLKAPNASGGVMRFDRNGNPINAN